MMEPSRSLGAFDVPESRIEESLGEVESAVAALDESGQGDAAASLARAVLSLLRERSRQLADYRLSLRAKFSELLQFRREVEAGRDALAPELARLATWQAELERREAAVGLDADTRARLLEAMATPAPDPAPVVVDALAEREKALRSLEEDLARREAVLVERRRGLDEREQRLDALEAGRPPAAPAWRIDASATAAGAPVEATSFRERLAATMPPPAVPAEAFEAQAPPAPPSAWSREDKLEELARRKREALLRSGNAVASRPQAASQEPASTPAPESAPASKEAAPPVDHFGELFSHLAVPGVNGRGPRRP